MRFSSSVQEKEAALNLTIDVFCRLVKQHTNVAQLLTMYAYSSTLFNFLYCTYHSFMQSYSSSPIVPPLIPLVRAR